MDVRIVRRLVKYTRMSHLGDFFKICLPDAIFVYTVLLSSRLLEDISGVRYVIKMSWDLSEMFWNVPEMFWNIPETSWDFPEMSWNISEISIAFLTTILNVRAVLLKFKSTGNWWWNFDFKKVVFKFYYL